MNLALDNYDANYDYTVVRNHNGKLTELSTMVEQGTISFETNQFSTYIIVKKSKAAGVDKPSTTPSTNYTIDDTGSAGYRCYEAGSQGYGTGKDK